MKEHKQHLKTIKGFAQVREFEEAIIRTSKI